QITDTARVAIKRELDSDSVGDQTCSSLAKSQPAPKRIKTEFEEENGLMPRPSSQMTPCGVKFQIKTEPTEVVDSNANNVKLEQQHHNDDVECDCIECVEEALVKGEDDSDGENVYTNPDE